VGDTKYAALASAKRLGVRTSWQHMTNILHEIHILQVLLILSAVYSDPFTTLCECYRLTPSCKETYTSDHSRCEWLLHRQGTQTKPLLGHFSTRGFNLKKKREKKEKKRRPTTPLKKIFSSHVHAALESP